MADNVRGRSTRPGMKLRLYDAHNHWQDERLAAVHAHRHHADRMMRVEG